MSPRWGVLGVTALLVAGCAAGASDQGAGSEVAAPPTLESVELVEAAQFGRGRAVAAATDGSTMIVATTVGVVSRTLDSDETIEYPTSLTLPVVEVSLTADGTAVLLQDAVRAAELWSVDPEPELLAALADVESVEFTDDGTTLLVADSASVRQLSTTDGSPTPVGTVGPGEKIVSVAWDTATGESVVVVDDGERSTATRWSAGATPRPIEPGEFGGEDRLLLDATRDRLVVGSPRPEDHFEGRLSAWDLATSETRFTIDVGTVADSSNWAIGADGRLFTVDGSHLRLIDPDGEEVTTWARRSIETVASIIALRHGEGYAVVDAGGSITVVDADGHATAALASSGRLLTHVDEFAGTPGMISVDDQGRIRMWGTDGMLVAGIDDYLAGAAREVTVSPSG